MRITPFIPEDDAGKNTWLQNFSAKLPQYISKYSITPEELSMVQQNAAAFDYWINYNHQLDAFKKKLTDFKNELIIGNSSGNVSVPQFPSIGPAPASGNMPGIFIHARSLAARIKKHMSYTEADGQDLGIVIRTVALDPESMQPEIRIRLLKAGSTPEIIWHKKGMDRIEIHVDRGDGFKFLAFDTYPNYIDDFPLENGKAAIWKYKAIYKKNDTSVGKWSGIVSVTVTGQAP